MSDTNKEEIQRLKSLCTELLSEYEALNILDKSNDTEESVLLKQSLLEDYNYKSDDSQLINSYKFKDEELDSEETEVKTLIYGRHL